MFHEVRFPDTPIQSSSGGPLFSTSLTDSPGGFEQRTGNWQQDRSKWDTGLGNRSDAETLAMIAFFRVVAIGKAHAFRFHDFQPGEFEAVDEYLGTGNGTQLVFQLQQSFAQGAELVRRPITKPVEGSVVVKVDGVAQPGVSVNHATGAVQFGGPPVGVVTASYGYDKPARLDTDWLQITTIEPGVCSWEGIPVLEVRDIA